MATRLQALSGKQYDGVMDFMYDLQAEGFTDEFDNSLVMRMAWHKAEELKLATKSAGTGLLLSTALQPNLTHQWDLIVTMQLKGVEDFQVTMALFVRNERIAVSSNVITEEVRPEITDLPLSGETLYLFQVEELMRAHKRFNKKALTAVKAVYRTVAPRGDDTACRLHVQPTQSGWQVGYKLHGKAVLSVHFTYTEAT